MNDRAAGLFPRPRRIERIGAGGPSEPAGRPVLVGDLPPSGYRLRPTADGVVIEGADAAGLTYAGHTLEVLGDEAGAWFVEDWPDLGVRGVMLDVSRDRVPTMESLRALVARLGQWRINQLQLYMEHTFAYREHEDVWRHASPFTPDEIVELDTLCTAHHVELVPNQNCLGHFERWLRHDRYRSLALTPDGFEWFGMRRGPTTLDPADPAAFALVRSLLRELLASFTSAQVNVGLDEPWELAPERFDEYVAWITALGAAPEADGRQLVMWGDIVAHHPDRVGDVPAGVTVADWGYEADHPFGERAAALAAAGRPFVLCPGTSSWQTILGRTTNMVGNVAAAADAARAHGGDGIVVTDWGDFGHLQPPSVSLPGLAYAAGMAWCADANRDTRAVPGVDDRLWMLGDVYRCAARRPANTSMLVRHLYFPQRSVSGLTPEEIEDAKDSLRRGRPSDDESLAVGVDLVDLLLDDALARGRGDGSLASIPAAIRGELSERLGLITTRHAEQWLRSSRPGGLAESRRWLDRLRQAYDAGAVPAGWPFPEVDLENAPPLNR